MLLIHRGRDMITQTCYLRYHVPSRLVPFSVINKIMKSSQVMNGIRNCHFRARNVLQTHWRTHVT